MKTTSTQFYANQYYENMPQQYYQEQPEQQEMDYEEPVEYVHTRRSELHKEYGSSGGKLPNIEYEYDESQECKCSCSRCKNTRKPPKPCCRETCVSCNQSEMQYQQGQGSLVFVPYPYPVMVPNAMNDTTTSTSTTTTTTTMKTPAKPKNTRRDSSEWKSTSSIEPGLFGRSYIKSQRKSSAETINDLILRSPHNLKGDRKYMLTSMRKTKPTWEPKYGIVPIPDNLAEKLMSQLRQVRELQAKRYK